MENNSTQSDKTLENVRLQCVEEAKKYISGVLDPYEYPDRISWLIQEFFAGTWYDPEVYEYLWEIDTSIRKGKSIQTDSKRMASIDSRITEEHETYFEEVGKGNTDIKEKSFSAFKYLNVNINKVYPALVVSTMSSGKSTLINALVGTDLLPSMNRACTSKAVAILDNDWIKHIEVHIADKTGMYIHIEKASQQTVGEYCRSDDVSEMIIEGEIKGIKNSKKSLLLIDTPGINNSMDMSHEAVTRKTLDDCPEGIIIYVINAQQIGTYDDHAFLTYISQKMRANSNFKIVFVVNKMDLIDPSMENPGQLINNCREYIETNGIEAPTIIPVSASSALIFKKVLAGTTLSEFEEENFYRNFVHFKRDGISLQDYAYTPQNGDLESQVIVDGKQYTRGQVLAALHNTGVPLLEKIIDEMMVSSLKMGPPKITAK